MHLNRKTYIKRVIATEDIQTNRQKEIQTEIHIERKTYRHKVYRQKKTCRQKDRIERKRRMLTY